MSAPYLSRHHAMTLLFLHIPKNIQLEKCTITHLTLIYLSFTEGWSQKFRVQEKISRSRHAEVWLQSTDKNARNFIFCRAQGSPTHVLTERIPFNISDKGYHGPEFMLHSHRLIDWNERWSRFWLFKTLRASWCFFSVSGTLALSNKANTPPAPSCLFIRINAVNQF